MGIWDIINDLVEAAAPCTTAEAEAPAKEDQEPQEETKNDSSKAEQEDNEDDEEEEEEEDDDEPKDPKEQLEEECKNSKQCEKDKHHFDACVERVNQQVEEHGSAKEDCVEEFFHLAHCAGACAAPKLWSVLK